MMFLIIFQSILFLSFGSGEVVSAGTTKEFIEETGSPRTVYACEGSTVTIECADGLVIRILRANYGRFSMAICNDGRQSDTWSLECMSSRALRIVSDLCEGKSGRCSPLASNGKFGDPCPNTPKYLEVQYRCETEKLSSVENPPENYTFPRFSTQSQSKNTTSRISSRPFTTTPASRPSRYPPRSRAPYSRPPRPVTTSPRAPRFCEPTHLRKVHWPRSRPGEKVYMECPNNRQVRNATWICGTDPVEWMDYPDLSGCVSPQITTIQNMLHENHDHFDRKIVEVVAADLMQLTEPVEDVFGGDLTSVTAAMQEAVEQVDTHVHEFNESTASHLVNKVNQAVLHTSSNLLDKHHFDSWKDLPQSEQAQTATRMISTLENSAYQVAKTIQKPTIIVNVTVNIVVEVHVVNVDKPVNDMVFPSYSTNQFEGTDWVDCENTITLTGNTIRQLGVNGLAKVIFATYNNLNQWLNAETYHDDYEAGDDPDTIPEIKVRHGNPIWKDPVDDSGSQRDEEVSENEVVKASEHEKKDFVNSKIISASVNGRNGEQVELEEPILYTLEHLTPEDNIYNPSCSFWDYSEKTMDGGWSNFGCEVLHTNTSHTTCSCNHLTNFAVLMSVRDPLAPLTNRQKFALSFLTYFGCILSIVCLIICFITFICFKNLQCDRNTIHTNLVACLCIAEVVFLFGIVQYDKPIFCSVIAALLHYLFLVTFAWMCLEGIQLYVMLVEVFEVEKSRMKWYYLAAYGIPAIIVAISATVYYEGYGTEMHCWLTTDKGFIWAFVGPVCAILVVNIAMLTVAITVMCRHASSAANHWKMRQKSNFENVRSWVKGALVLVVLLGLTWAFGLFYINEQSIVMAYVFTILNSLQGVFIFIFHCIMNDKVLKEYKRWVRHTTWLPMSLRIKCGGARPSISTTPVNTSSSGGKHPLKSESKLSFEHLSRLLSGGKRKRSSTTSLPSSTNLTKRGYNRIQRNSSGRDSGHLTDSGIGCNDDISHIYSEPTEDPSAYLEPRRFDTNDVYMTGGDISTIEGSVADTDYMDNFGCRNLTAINVDKYKIMPMSCYKNRLSVTSEGKPASESDYSEIDQFTLTPDGKKQPRCELERELLAMIPPETPNTNPLQTKLMPLMEDPLDLDGMIINNLNKSTDFEKHITEPNIEASDYTASGENDQSNELKTSTLPPALPMPLPGRERNYAEAANHK